MYCTCISSTTSPNPIICVVSATSIDVTVLSHLKTPKDRFWTRDHAPL